jgi:hypothetical protein
MVDGAMTKNCRILDISAYHASIAGKRHRFTVRLVIDEHFGNDEVMTSRAVHAITALTFCFRTSQPVPIDCPWSRSPPCA